MKQISLIEDSVSFGIALKKKSLYKSPTPLFKSSSKKSFNQLSTNLLQPKIKCIQRTNLTLKNLLKQYKKYPQNQYVLKLKPCNKDIPQKVHFDLWISSLESQRTQQQHNNLKKDKEQLSFIDSFIAQNSNNKSSQQQVKLIKIETQTTQQLSNSSVLDKQFVKYSFSQYFEASQQNSLSNKKNSLQQQFNQNQQLRNNNDIKNDYNMTIKQKIKINKIKQQITSISKRMIMKAQHFQDQYYNVRADKQNQDINIRNNDKMREKGSKQKLEVKGLQFSKNKRFKSSKKAKNEIKSKIE